MLLTLMKSKIHRARVTQCDMHYEGSISIDRDWLDEVGILPYEQVDVLNINTGARFTTYAIEAPRWSQTIGNNDGKSSAGMNSDGRRDSSQVWLILSYEF